MREMVFNHVSAVHVDVGQNQIVEWLRDITMGMAKLVNERVVGSALRMEKTFVEIDCLPDYTLYGALQSLRQVGHRDEYVFLLRLATKSPLINGVDDKLLDRFSGCHGRTYQDFDGAPLVLCAIADWIAISMPSEPYWDHDRIKVQFDEILADERIEEASEDVDQLSRLQHADSIHKRNMDKVRAGTDPREIWVNRDAIFPNLSLAPGIQGDLQNCANVIQTVVGKLSVLDRSAGSWTRDGGPAPIWGVKVSPERTNDMKNAKFRNNRTFRSCAGTQEIFEWHARYGDSGRIHLRFDAKMFEVEIGYIGPHLESEV